MKPMAQIKSDPFIAILAVGMAATIAQIIYLRELMVLFYGNELSVGLVFAGWLLWSGLGSGLSGKWSGRFSSGPALLGWMMAAFAVLLPISIFIIRASAVIWTLPPGEVPSFGKTLFIVLTATGMLCPISGALFGACWAVSRKMNSDTSSSAPLMIYLGEALGAACGGLVFYFVFLTAFHVFTSALITSVCSLLVSAWLIRPETHTKPKRTMWALWTFICLWIFFSILWGGRVDSLSRRLQWGPHHVAVFDSAYNNIAIAKRRSQFSVFTNGLWLFSVPDRLGVEQAVHLAMLQHPDPRSVLILSGGMAGLIAEIVNHPHVDRIDDVEPDPGMIHMATQYLPADYTESMNDPRVTVHLMDPRTFLGKRRQPYDVILMNMGDPITAQMNRFYTEAFFQKVKARMAPEGVFSFAVSGGEDMLGENQARFLASIRKTLTHVFAEVFIYPGDHTRFFATDHIGLLIKKPSVLASRMAERNLDLRYIREDYLADALNPFRLDYIRAVLDGLPDTVVNQDFTPVCFRHTLMMWAVQWHPALAKRLNQIAAVPVAWIWAVLAGCGVLSILASRIGQGAIHLTVSSSVLVSGTIEMVLQLILLLGFQIVAGYVYKQLALIIAFFMTGLAAGAGVISLFGSRIRSVGQSLRLFMGAQFILGLIPIGLILLFPVLMRAAEAVDSPAVIGLIFSTISFGIGLAGGSHFALAVSSMSAWGASLSQIGGRFYALDLLGAAMGVLFAACLVIPIYGVMQTLFFLSGLSGICLLMLYSGSPPRKRE